MLNTLRSKEHLYLSGCYLIPKHVKYPGSLNNNSNIFQNSDFTCICITPWTLTAVLDGSHCKVTLLQLYSIWEMILLPKNMNEQRPVSCV